MIIELWPRDWISEFSVLWSFHISQALLLSERESAEEARKACMDAEVRNTELVKKLEDTEEKVGQLQESMQRFVDAIESSSFYFVLFMQINTLLIVNHHLCFQCGCKYNYASLYLNFLFHHHTFLTFFSFIFVWSGWKRNFAIQNQRIK